MSKHPTFSRGHCFMTEPLNKTEVEIVGEIIIQHMQLGYRNGELDEAEIDRLNEILIKMDYPTFDKVTK